MYESAKVQKLIKQINGGPQTSKKECGQCKKIKDRLSMTKEKMLHVNNALQHQQEKRIKLQTDLDDIKVLHEQKDAAFQNLKTDMEEYFNDPEAAPKLSKIAQTKIHALSNNIKLMEEKKDDAREDYFKRRNMHERQKTRCKTLNSEVKFMKEKTKEQEEAQKNFKRNATSKINELRDTINEQNDEIEELDDTFMQSLDLLKKIIISSAFERDDLNVKIKNLFSDLESNGNETL